MLVMRQRRFMIATEKPTFYEQHRCQGLCFASLYRVFAFAVVGCAACCSPMAQLIDMGQQF
jgi:hypothetical protein